MYDIRQFRPTLYLLIALGFTGFAIAVGAPFFWLLGWLAIQPGKPGGNGAADAGNGRRVGIFCIPRIVDQQQKGRRARRRYRYCAPATSW